MESYLLLGPPPPPSLPTKGHHANPFRVYYKTCHSLCGSVVTSPWFQHFILALITINSILTALQTYEFVQDNLLWQQRLDQVDTILLILFTVELVLHLFYYGFITFLSNAWLVFDLLIVTVSWACAALTIMRSFRIVRTVRFMTHVREIQQLVEALWNVVPRMFAIFTFLLLVYFVFAVLLTDLFQTAYQDGITSEDHFSRLDVTAFTLLQFMFLDDWSGLTKELMVAHPWAWIPILAFIILCTFIVVNLIIAVICDAVQALQTDEMATHLKHLQTVTIQAIQQAHAQDQDERRQLEIKVNQLLQLLQQQQQQQSQQPQPQPRPQQ